MMPLLLNYLKNLKDTFRVLNSLRNRIVYYPQIFITNRCNSRCNICNIWKKNPKIDIPVKLISNLLEAKSIHPNAKWGIGGGEALLHPEIEKILELFSEKDYALLSNGILTDRIIELVKKFDVKKVFISLDGNRTTYERVRGGNWFLNVLDTIKHLKKVVTLVYVINPFNTSTDFDFVKNITEKYNLPLNVVVYDYRKILSSKVKFEPYDITYETEFLKGYKKWKEGNYNPLCLSLLCSSTVIENGDVLLCQNKGLVLGNLHNNIFDEIWNSKRTIELQKRYLMCNACWTACNRGLDNILYKYRCLSFLYQWKEKR